MIMSKFDGQLWLRSAMEQVSWSSLLNLILK